MFTSRYRCARAKIPRNLWGVTVGKFLGVTLNGTRVGVRIANVISIFPVRDNNKFDVLRFAYSGLPRDRCNK